MKSTPVACFLLLLVIIPALLMGQGRKYEGPDDPAGDIAAIREGWMNGNRVLLYFKNTTELANWPNFDQSKWPNDYTGTGMHDGIALWIVARVHMADISMPGIGRLAAAKAAAE